MGNAKIDSEKELVRSLEETTDVKDTINGNEK